MVFHQAHLFAMLCIRDVGMREKYWPSAIIYFNPSRNLSVNGSKVVRSSSKFLKNYIMFIPVISATIKRNLQTENNNPL